MIRLGDISVIFNKGSVDEVPALKKINLSINKGEFVVIIGSNGSGKSTLLNCIAGSLYPDSGSIFVNNVNITRWPDHRRTSFVSRVFQNPLQSTCSELTVLENFRLAALRGVSKGLRTGIDESYIRDVKEKISVLGMGLENRVHHLMQSLSGGQRQALTLAMAAMNKPDILLLDEPTAALDPRSSAVVMESAARLIKEYGLTAILVTHNLKDAEKYGSRLIQMNEGAVVRDYLHEHKKGISIAEIHEWFI